MQENLWLLQVREFSWGKTRDNLTIVDCTWFVVSLPRVRTLTHVAVQTAVRRALCRVRVARVVDETVPILLYGVYFISYAWEIIENKLLNLQYI